MARCLERPLAMIKFHVLLDEYFFLIFPAGTIYDANTIPDYYGRGVLYINFFSTGSQRAAYVLSRARRKANDILSFTNDSIPSSIADTINYPKYTILYQS